MATKARLVTLMPIRKMDRAIRFYTRALGAKKLVRATGAMRNMWASVELAGGALWLVAPERFERRTLAYTTLLVPNIRSTVRGLERKRVKFDRPFRGSPQARIDGPIVFEPWGAGAWFKDSEGNRLMLWQNLSPG